MSKKKKTPNEQPPFIFDGFEPANTTPVPDVLFDVLLSEMSGAALKVFLYIVRRTLGFKKPTDAISFNQFLHGITTKDGRVLDKGCGVTNRTVLSRALAELEALGCITVTKGKDPHGDNATTLYGIKFKVQGVVSNPYHMAIGGSIKSGLPVVSNRDYGSIKSVPGVVSNRDQQETVIQQTDSQDTEKQKITEDTHGIVAHADDTTLTIIFDIDDVPDFSHVAQLPVVRQWIDQSPSDTLPTLAGRIDTSPLHAVGDTPSLVSHPEHSFLWLDDLLVPSLMVVKLTPAFPHRFYSEQEDKRRERIVGWEMMPYLKSKGIKVDIRWEHESEEKVINATEPIPSEPSQPLATSSTTPAVTISHSTTPPENGTPQITLHSHREPADQNAPNSGGGNVNSSSVTQVDAQPVDHSYSHNSTTSEQEATKPDVPVKPTRTHKRVAAEKPAKVERPVKSAPPPLSEEEQAFEAEYSTRRAKWQEYINKRRGGALRGAGPCINETKCFNTLVREFTDEEIAAIDEYLVTQDWRYKKNPQKIGGKELLDESRPALKWMQEHGRVAKPSTSQKPASNKPVPAMTHDQAWQLVKDACQQVKQMGCDMVKADVVESQKTPGAWLVQMHYDDVELPTIKAPEQWSVVLKDIVQMYEGDKQRAARLARRSRLGA